MTREEFFALVDTLGPDLDGPLWVLTEDGMVWRPETFWYQDDQISLARVYMQVWDEGWVAAFGSIESGPGTSSRGGRFTVCAEFDTYVLAADTLIAVLESVRKMEPELDFVA